MNIKIQENQIEEMCPLTLSSNKAKYLTRHTFFDNIKTEIQAYLLGFYAADGNIHSETNKFNITVTQQDKEIVEFYRLYISPDRPIRTLKGSEYNIAGVNGISKDSVVFTITSEHLIRSLKKLGIGDKKTYDDFGFPNISSDLLPHFIRGYFDGDGTFCLGLQKPNVGRRINYSLKYSFYLVSKTKKLLEDVKDFFQQNNIKTKIETNVRNEKTTYRLVSYSKSECIKIYNLLYADSNLYLSRKYNKFTLGVSSSKEELVKILLSLKGYNYDPSRNQTSSS